MTNIIETKFGTLVNTSKIAAGSASSIKKTGAFYVGSFECFKENNPELLINKTKFLRNIDKVLEQKDQLKNNFDAGNLEFLDTNLNDFDSCSQICL